MAVGRARLRQIVDANKRQLKRREAAKELNALSAELLDAEVQVHTRRLLSSEPRVEQLIRALEPRCHTPGLAWRLRAAAEKWGRKLRQPVAAIVNGTSRS